MRKMIIASTSSVYGSDYLAYLLPEISLLFKDADTVLFIPYARPSGISYDEYTRIVKNAFAKISKKVIGIHQFDNQKEALENAKAIFTGGGNTFELVNQLYKNDILALLKKVLENGTPYLGTSAGGNICGVSMMTTNDMPIVYPPSFYTLGCLPFNINAHFIDPLPNSTHMGETRETRIKEFHVFNDTPVLGLREGSWLRVIGNVIKLEGNFTAKWFQPTRIPIEIESGSEFDS
ncbi:MAG: (alpha)-aspartyl dipeptidase [Cryomorphaceae bacterium BACL22 MAG-120619-bin32]|jgi:dipeptidase E|nr:MAG: (alpha)-aspartyl dipeptidase [Cryomorphaceae bacterium BACL22 MAG-120619-bin32]